MMKIFLYFTLGTLFFGFFRKNPGVSSATTSPTISNTAKVQVNFITVLIKLLSKRC